MPADDEELLRRLSSALAPEDREPEPARISALRTAAEQVVVDRAAAQHLGRRPSGRSLAIFGAAAAVAVALAMGSVAIRNGAGRPERTGGVVEFETTLRAPGGGASAKVTGLRTGVGRIIELRTRELPVLPKSEYYEVWFVGPDDTPDAPNRISAGTFHPDENGRSDVELTVAVDPSKYARLSVTAEPGDGDPGPNGSEVLRATVRVTG